MRLSCLFLLTLFMVSLAGAEPDARDESRSTQVKNGMPGPNDRVTMDFHGVELGQVVRLLAEMTGKNYVLDPQVKGKVTVVTPTSVSVSEAEKIFSSILSVHELTIVERDGAFKIVPLQAGIAEGKSPVSHEGMVSGPDETITSRLVRLKHVDAGALATTLKPLMHPWGSLSVHAPTNALIVTDAAVTTQKLILLIETMDLPEAIAIHRLFPLRHANVATIEKLVNAIYADYNSRRRKEEPGVKLFSDVRTNILIAVSDLEQMSRLEPLITSLDIPVKTNSGNLHIYYPKNSEAENIAKVLTSLLTSAGTGSVESDELKSLAMMRSVKVVSEKATNTLVIAATPEDYQVLLPIIHGLDLRRSQIHVEALIIEVSAERAAEFGVEWRFGNMPTTGSDAFTGIGGSSFDATPNPLDLGKGMTVGLLHGTLQWGSTVVPDIPALIRAFQSEGDINILATPNIVTMDGMESEIVVGQNIPIVSGTTTATAASATASPGVVSQAVERKDVGLTLRVTPRVIENEWLEMKIYQEQSNVTPASIRQLDAGTMGNGVVTNKRSIKTTVNLKSGHTVVLGGLIKEEHSEQVGMVPCLGGISGVGELFKKTNRSNNKSNLMVFMRPIITHQFDDWVHLSQEKYRSSQETWGTNPSKGSSWIPPFTPAPLPDYPPPQNTEEKISSPMRDTGWN